MTFTTLAFAVLLAIVVALRLTIGRSKQETSYLYVLVIASIVFYAWHIPWHLLLLLLVTVFNYFAALRIAAAKIGSHASKLILGVSVVLNLGLLAAFKYTNFAISSVNDVFRYLNIATTLPAADIVLPIGISFYIFHALSYIIDVYRGKTKPLTNILSFLLYLAFFPQLVSGPIVRAREFLYQIDRRRRLSMLVFASGCYLMIRGFFLKLVVSDNISSLVDKNWAMAASPTAGRELPVTVAVLFAVQIFADFSGYTDIARGVAYILGYRLPLNFNAPYIASSFSEFWRRWHISLSSWLRDYLYLPLGGNRRSTLRTYANLIIVMLLGGLWHGASWTFVIWGGIHGAALAVERALGWQRLGAWWARFAWFIVVQLLVLVAWVFFRSTSVTQANMIIMNMVAGIEPASTVPNLRPQLIYVLPIVAMHARTFLSERRLVPHAGAIESGVWAAVMLYLALTYFGATSSPFIYFQF